MICADYHVHSAVSPDADVVMEDMCEGALGKGLEEIVFTDHYEFYANGITRPFFHEQYLQGYFRDLERCRERYEGRLRIKAGMEFGQLHLEREKAAGILGRYPFDFVIGSVHKLNNIDLEKLTYTKVSIQEIGDAYYQSLEQLAKEGDFDCLGHLDLFKRHARRHGFSEQFERYEKQIRRILHILIQRGKGIEINTSGIRQEAHEAMPGPTVLQLYKELGGTIITIGSDAHKAEHIAGDFEAAEQLLKAAGFKNYTLFEGRHYYHLKL